jgi:Zn-dependent protease
MDNTLITGFLVWYLVFLFSTTLHEAMHSFVSAHGGDHTARLGGQATLNPIPHIQRSMFGMVVAPILTFILSGGSYLIGWASAPFNVGWAARYPKKAFWMSLAGPLSHLPLLCLSFAAMYVGMRTGYFGPGFGDPAMLYPVAPAEAGDNLAWALSALCGVAFRLNLILFIFNLLPIPPMDGSEVWYLFMRLEETRLRWRCQMAQYGMAGLMLAWYVFPRVEGPVKIYLVANLLWGMPVGVFG